MIALLEGPGCFVASGQDVFFEACLPQCDAKTARVSRKQLLEPPPKEDTESPVETSDCATNSSCAAPISTRQLYGERRLPVMKESPTEKAPARAQHVALLVFLCSGCP